MKALLALRILLPLLAVASGCGHRSANERVFRHGKQDYAVLVPAGWSIQEVKNGAVRIEASGPKDTNGQAASMYIMVVDRPDGWSWSKDVEDLCKQFSNYTFIAKGTQERAGRSYTWVSFLCDQAAARHKNLNCTISVGKKIITLACFADEKSFSELEPIFKRSVFSIEPGNVDQE